MPLIEKYDAKTGDFIEVLPGVKTASEDLDCSVVTVWRHLDKPSPINGFLIKRGPNGRKELRDQAIDFHRWHVQEPASSCTNRKKKEVLRVDLRTMEVEKYDTISQAAQFAGVTDRAIARAARCLPGYEVVAGYAWAFVHED